MNVMKKIIFALAFIFIAFALTACSFGGDGGARTAPYLELLQSGEYSLSANGYFAGVHNVVTEDVSNGNFQITYRNDNDTVFHYLYSDGHMYCLAWDLGYYAEISEDYQPPEEVFANMIDYDYSTAVYSGSGKQSITGITYPYDTYQLKTYDGRETTLNIYIDDSGDLFALAFPDDAIQITLNYLTAELPEDACFTIPEDMEEIEFYQIETMLGM